VQKAFDPPSTDGEMERPLAEARPTVLVLDREAQDAPGIVAQAAVLHAEGVRVRSLTLFYDEWLAKLPVSELERASMLFDIGELHKTGYVRTKRLLDIPMALAGGLVLVVLLPFVWLGNRVANRGPLFYRQDRVGKGGEVFSILKFRTMAPRPGGDLANEWTTVDDPRITGFGHVLRKTHLDELPQVVNILKGDLGVVGPRPEQPHYVAELEDKLPFYGLRHLVRPGLTGWAQVKYGYAGNESDALEKLQYEFWYLRHQSLRNDARIIGRTIRSVLGGEGGGR
jgi:lipopolysaccharide/colanic/teichoic acid biosynthesis glycosyltransferase